MIVAEGSYQGGNIRPINLGRDVPAILKLLNLVFSPTLDASERQSLNTLSSQPYLVMRLGHATSPFSPGFVWVEQGNIIGNVSLIPTKQNYRVIVANVAVHPDHRRRGIAQRLMETSLNHLVNHRVRTVMLQVDVDNGSASRLYERLNFHTIGTQTYWQCSAGRVREITSNKYQRAIRPLRRNEYKRAFELDAAVRNVELNWPDPLLPNAYRVGLQSMWHNFMYGKAMETWVLPDPQDRMLAIGSIRSEWGKAHKLSLRCPETHSDLARPLLAKLLRRLGYLRRRSVAVEHAAYDEVMNQLLNAANFRPKRTLSTMKLSM